MPCCTERLMAPMGNTRPRFADFPDVLPNSLFKWLKRRGLAPHQLRHFYATVVVRHANNPELARRQLRHANLQTTLQVYAQVESEDISQLLDAV